MAPGGRIRSVSTDLQPWRPGAPHLPKPGGGAAGGDGCREGDKDDVSYPKRQDDRDLWVGLAQLLDRAVARSEEQCRAHLQHDPLRDILAGLQPTISVNLLTTSPPSY